MSAVTISGANRTTRRIQQPSGEPTAEWTHAARTPPIHTPVAHTPTAHTPATRTQQATCATPRWFRWAGIALTGVGLAMVPWLGFLATGLPPRLMAGGWNTAWVGLDALEALGMFATGTLLRRRDPRAALTAAATATLLFIDAWFDVLASSPGGRFLAIAMAVGAELPISALCAALALRLFPRK